jgi:hypothetical protein
MIAMSVNLIALLLGASLLASRRDDACRLWRYARAQARSESDANAHSAQWRPERGSGAIGGALFSTCRGATISLGAKNGARDEARLLRRITSPGPETMRRS